MKNYNAAALKKERSLYGIPSTDIGYLTIVYKIPTFQNVITINLKLAVSTNVHFTRVFLVLPKKYCQSAKRIINLINTF